MACPDCGFDPTSISPADAVVALRSLPRRYREAAGPAADDADSDDGGRVADQDREQAQRRALVASQAAQAATAIAALGEDLRRVLISDDPPLSTTDETATSAGGDAEGADIEAAIARLAEATAGVVSLVEGQPATAWKRTGRRASGPRSAATLLGEAVHAGVHHLRLAQQSAS
jgi:hypothetical protein